MLTPLSWLKDYVDIDVTPKELEENYSHVVSRLKNHMRWEGYLKRSSRPCRKM